MQISVIIQIGIFVAAVFLMVRGSEALHEVVQNIESALKTRGSAGRVVVILPVVLYVVFLSGRISTAESILPLLFGFSLFAYGVLLPYVVATSRQLTISLVLRQCVLPVVATYVLLGISAMDGMFDRFESFVMMVLAVIIWFGTSRDPIAVAENVVRSRYKILVTTGIAVIAVCLGSYYIFIGSLFFVGHYALSLSFVALTGMAVVVALPLLRATLIQVEHGENERALRALIETTLLATLMIIGISGVISPLAVMIPLVVSGMQYMFFIAGVVLSVLLTSYVERRTAALIFLLCMFCVVKLVVLV